MGKTITPDQRAWVQKMSKTLGATAQPISLAFPPRNAAPAAPYTLPIPKIDPAFFEQLEKERKEREKTAEAALEKACKWLRDMPMDSLRKMTIPEILAKIKDDYPEVADLPKKKMLMDRVEKVLQDRHYMLEKGLLGDPSKLAMEKIIGTYIAALPSNIKAIVAGGGITLVMKGAAPSVGGATADDAKPGAKKPEKFEFKNKDYTIKIANEAWKALDPALRAKWKGLNDEATALEKLEAMLTSLKKEWESSKPDGSKSKVELEARIKDLEGEFKGRWETLQKAIEANAKLTTDGLKASITDAKKKVKDDKLGAELELKFEEMSASLKLFASTPSLKAALTVTGSAEKIAAKIEAEAIKTGTAVTLQYEKALKEVKEALELQVKHGKTEISAKLSKEAVKLEEKLKEFKDSEKKDFETVKGLEEGLHKLQLEVKAKFEVGVFKLEAGGKVASDGEAGGKVKVEMMLKEGIRFLPDGQKISFSVDVSNKGYTFALMFSVGDMPKLDDVKKANDEATEKIGKLYDLVKDAKIRTMDDAKQIQEAMSEVLKPLKKSVSEMKKLDKKKYAVEVGITLTGEFRDDGGRMPPPVPGVGIKVLF